MKTPDGSAGDSAKTFMFGALNGDNNVSCICLAKDGLESPYTYYDAILYGIFSNIGNFSEGQPIVTANSYQGSGSIPLFKLGEAGATTTSITDDNYTNYTTTEKLSKLTAGLYYVNTDKLSVNLKGIDIKSQISTLFPQTNVDDTISVEKGSQITVTAKQAGSPETGYQTQKLVNIYNTTQGLGYPYSIFFVDAENNPNQALVSMGTDLINTALSYSYSAANQLGEIMNTCITDESLRGKVPVISAPDEQTATGVKNVFKAVDFPKGVPITTINTTNKSEFTTLKGILNHPDGMYLVDDCGVTNGDPQLTIASFKGHCSTMLMESITGFQEVVDATEIKCYKGSTIYILTQENISDGATRYISICNVPAMASGLGNLDISDYDRMETFADAGTSTINIEIHAVSSSSNGKTTYSYDIDGGTKTLFTYPMYVSYILSACTSFLMNSISGDSSPSPGDLVSVVKDETVPYVGKKLIGLRASEFLPFTIIHNRNATNYNTLDKLCHLNDGLYVCNAGAYQNNDNYIFEIEFKGINLTNAVTASFTGTEPTPDTNGNTKCKNGTIISVATKTQHFDTKSKIIRITQGLNADLSSSGNGFDDIYIIAEPDDSSASTLVYGVTGTNVKYYRPFSVNAIYGNILPFAAMNQTLSDGTNANGKMAVWNKPKGAEMPTLGFADIPNSSPIIEVNDSNFSNFDTLRRWMNANAGTYLVKTTKLTVSVEGVDQTKSSDNSFSRTLSIPSDTYVYVYSTDDSNSSATNFKNVVFQKADNMPSGYYGEWMTFKWDTRHIYSADNVEFFPLMTAAINGSGALEMVMEVSNLFADLSASDAGKVVKVTSGDKADSYKFQAVDISLIGDTTTITPAQVLSAVNEGKTTTISHTDTTYGKLKFTSFGVVTTASGDTVSSSITYGTSADSLMLFTLMGDVTKGTWTMYSRNLTVST